jgi:hypothetical protein
MLCSRPRQLRIVAAPAPGLLEFEDELAERQRGDLAQLHRAEPPLDVRVPQAAVLPAGAPLQMDLGIQTPEVAHEPLERLVARFEHGEVSGALEQPQASTKIQGVLRGVECSLGALAPRILEPDSVDVIDLATAAATLANLNPTDWLRAHVYVYRRLEPRVRLRRATMRRLRPAKAASKRLTPPKRPRDILRRLSPKGQPAPESAFVLGIFSGAQVVTASCALFLTISRVAIRLTLTTIARR